MNRKMKWLSPYCIVLILIVLYLLYFLYNYQIMYKTKNATKQLDSKYATNTIHLAVVACGQRLQETLVMMKSALLFNEGREKSLNFIVFTEQTLLVDFREKLDDWMQLYPNKFNYEVLPLSFPAKKETEWRTLFKPCAAQRLFIPSILKSIDNLLYVDTDILFLSPVSDVWNFFKKFDATQLAALAPEHEDENVGWYNRFARHPYYGKLGVNSGVMLMNLTRMRDFNWEAHVLPIYEEYKLRITWGDQDIINILFYYHPEKLYVMPCEYNYRPDHCMYMNVCNSSINGIKIIHGNRGNFHSSKQPFFRALYEAVEMYQLGTDAFTNFLLPLEMALQDTVVKTTNCGLMSAAALQVAKTYFQQFIPV